VEREIDVQAGGETSLGALRLRPVPRITATVVNANGEALASAVLTSPRGEVLAAAGADGALAAELTADVPGYVEILADGFAPHRIQLDRFGGELMLGRVTLRHGATVTVMIDRTAIGPVPVKVSLLTGRPYARHREFLAREMKATETTVAFPPVEPGDYFIEVEGPTALARYTEAVRLPESGAIEKQIVIEPIQIMGELLIGSHHATSGQINLQPDDGGWEAGLEIADDGSFHAESWTKGKFHGFYVRDPARDGVFIRDLLEATSSPVHWHVVVPDRTIEGRIFDRETRQAVPNAGLDKDVQSEGSQSMGLVPVQPDGSFGMDAAEEGDYTLKVSAENYVSATVRFHVSATDTARTVDIPLDRAIIVAVNIVTPAGQPVAHATVIDGLGDGVNPDDVYTSDEAGQIRLRLRPRDRRTLYVLPPTGSFAIADVEAADAAGGIRVVVPPAAGSIRVHATLGGKAARGVSPVFRWNGRLVPPPIPRFFGFIHSSDAGLWTDDFGEVELKSMPAGVYEFFPLRGQPEAALREVSTMTPVRLGFGGGSVDVILDLPVTGSRSTSPRSD
jgi:hypothetical protein